MDNEWILVDIQRNGSTFHTDSWWKSELEGHTVWKNHVQHKSGHEERNYYIECRDERYGSTAQLRVAVKRIFK